MNLVHQNWQSNNQVVWPLMAKSSFQGRIRGIPGSIPRGNNVWLVRMPLRTSQISRPSLMGRKPERKSKKRNWQSNTRL